MPFKQEYWLFHHKLTNQNWVIKYWLFRGKWEYTYIIGYNFWHFIVPIENIVLPVMFINKLNVVLSFQNLKNNDIIYIFIYIFFFAKQFFHFQTFPIFPFYNSAFLTSFPILNIFLHPCSYASFFGGPIPPG